MKALAILVLVLAGLSACGGGGSGSSTNASGSLVSGDITIGALTPASINVTLPKVNQNGVASPQVSLSAPISGTTSGNVYVLVDDPDRVVQGASLVLGSSGASATLKLFLDQTVPVGTYTRPVTLRACKDALCTIEFAGSPQVVPKNVVITGTTASASALSFVSTAGVAPPAQSLAVTTPAGATFTYDTFTYVEFTPSGGSATLWTIDKVFDITTTATGLQVQPKGNWAGQYVLPLTLRTPGYADVKVNITYQVGAPLATTSHLTILTGPLSAASTVNSTADAVVAIDAVINVPTTDYRIDINYDPATPYNGSIGWLRYYDSTATSYGNPPAAGTRIRFFANACFAGISCLAAGQYRANIVLTATSFGFSDSYTIPVTFTVH